METLDILCLAVSRKYGGRCVAGLRMDGGGWVRPVSASPEGELDALQCTLADGSAARVLDVIRMQLGEPRSEPHQPENRLVGPRGWRLVARPAPPDVVSMLRDRLVSGPELLGCTEARGPYERYEREPGRPSLALVAPREIRWLVGTRPDGSRQVHVQFELRGAAYALPVADLLWEARLAHLPPDGYSCTDAGCPPGERYLVTVSRGEPYGADRLCYKIAAAIVPIPAAWHR